MTYRLLLPLALVAAGAFSFWVGSSAHDMGLRLLGVLSVFTAAATLFLPRIAVFLQVIAGIFALESALATVALAALTMIGSANVTGYFGAVNVIPLVVFVLLAFVVDRIPVLKRVFTIADGYLSSDAPRRWKLLGRVAITMKDKSFGTLCIAALVVFTQLEIVSTLSIAVANGLLVDAVTKFNAAAFWKAALVFIPLLFVAQLAFQLLGKVISALLDAQWRHVVTQRFLSGWLEGDRHYAMSLGDQALDNPDQRIQEDLGLLINTAGTSSAYGFVLFSTRTVQQIISTAFALWQISATLQNAPALNVVPGFLVWMAALWAVGPTLISYFISKPLPRLTIRQQAKEATFRFGLSRVREFSPQIALIKGGRAEAALSEARMVEAVSATLWQRAYNDFVILTNGAFAMLAVLAHYIVLAPFFFAGAISFGIFTQVGAHFTQMAGSVTGLTAIFQAFGTIKGNEMRVSALLDAIKGAGTQTPGQLLHGDRPDLVIDKVEIKLPDGQALSQALDLTLRPAESVLIMGPSGIGKSTLMRVIAGIWPFWTGRVEMPKGQTLLALPQVPYVPMAGLAAALTYPSEKNRNSRQDLRQVLVDVELTHLTDRLDMDDPAWSLGLSGGELQRLSLARALLLKPDWLLLDEATSAMDIPLEGRMYQMLREKLPATTIVSIGHRDSLIAHHDRVVTAVAEPERGFILVDGAPAFKFVAQ